MNEWPSNLHSCYEITYTPDLLQLLSPNEVSEAQETINTMESRETAVGLFTVCSLLKRVPGAARISARRIPTGEATTVQHAGKRCPENTTCYRPARVILREIINSLSPGIGSACAYSQHTRRVWHEDQNSLCNQRFLWSNRSTLGTLNAQSARRSRERIANPFSESKGFSKGTEKELLPDVFWEKGAVTGFIAVNDGATEL